MTETGHFDDEITITRAFYRVLQAGAGNTGNTRSTERIARETFEQGDLVRVEIKIDYSKKALHGAYSVTDYLPAGLAFAENTAGVERGTASGRGAFSYATVEGRKVTFFDFNSRFDRELTYYYYARVISPGTFKAEGPLVRNLIAVDYFTTGTDTTIVIYG